MKSPPVMECKQSLVP